MNSQLPFAPASCITLQILKLPPDLKLPTVLKCAELLRENFAVGNCVKPLKKQLKESYYFHTNENKKLTDNYNKQN